MKFQKTFEFDVTEVRLKPGNRFIVYLDPNPSLLIDKDTVKVELRVTSDHHKLQIILDGDVEIINQREK